MTASTTIAIMLIQLSTAQIQLNNLKVTGVEPISQVLSLPSHPEYLLKQTLVDFASTTAVQHHQDPVLFQKVVSCESGWDYKAVGGLGEVGIVQIYPIKHPGISKDQMLDPLWSLNWMAQQWEDMHQAWWSCWRSNVV